MPDSTNEYLGRVYNFAVCHRPPIILSLRIQTHRCRLLPPKRLLHVGPILRRSYLRKGSLPNNLSQTIKVQAATGAALQVQHQPPEVQPLLPRERTPPSTRRPKR